MKTFCIVQSLFCPISEVSIAAGEVLEFPHPTLPVCCDINSQHNRIDKYCRRLDSMNPCGGLCCAADWTAGPGLSRVTSGLRLGCPTLN